jgi:hypothetical protein
MCRPARQRCVQKCVQNEERLSSALVLTRSGASIDLTGVRYTMPGSDDDAPADSGHLSGAVLGVLKPANLHAESRAWCPADFPAPSSFTGCTVRCHEDVMRHIYGLFQSLGIQYSWVLTRGPLGSELVKEEDLAIDNAKEESWMTVYEHERDLLEDTVYHSLMSLWSEFSNACAVFDQHGPAQFLCAHQVWETLLANFPPNTSACKLSSLTVR